MKNTMPSYYNDFKCIGSKCSDNCCIGWEIDIDRETYNFYKNIKSEFGDKLNYSIEDKENPHFILDEERCPFLNKDNLCDIYINLGEDKLCDICKQHPRFYEWFNGLCEKGIGICCEEAGRLLFQNPNKLSFITYETKDENSKIEYDKDLFEILFFARETAFNITQNRDFTIEERMIMLLCFAYELQERIDFNENENLHEIIHNYNNIDFIKQILNNQIHPNKKEKDNYILIEIIKLYQELEPFNEEWISLLKLIESNIDIIKDNKKGFTNYYQNALYEYEHLLVYFIYRYFLKATFDHDLLSKVVLCILSYVVINSVDIYTWICEKKYDLNSRISICKNYSKEIEYSQENIDFLADECYFNSNLSFNSLISLLRN